jgi:hypothetical protein
MRKNTAEDQRREVRRKIVGDIMWSSASDQDKNSFRGAIIDESRYGLSILTLIPIKAGSTLRIYCEGQAGIRYATVMWCKEVVTDIYQSGLLMNEH